MRYALGQVIENTNGFGTVKVTDRFRSETTGQYCYCVQTMDGSEQHFLCWENELATGVWKTS